jgi:hypothetical protein
LKNLFRHLTLSSQRERSKKVSAFDTGLAPVLIQQVLQAGSAGRFCRQVLQAGSARRFCVQVGAEV